MLQLFGYFIHLLKDYSDHLLEGNEQGKNLERRVENVSEI